MHTLKKEGGNFEKQPWGGFSFFEKHFFFKFLTEYSQNLISPIPSLHSHRIALFAPLSRQSINYRVTVSRFGVSLPAPASPSLPSSQSSIETPRPGKRPAAHISPPGPDGATGGCSPTPLPMGEFQALFVCILSKPPNPTAWSPSRNLIWMVLHAACSPRGEEMPRIFCTVIGASCKLKL